MPDLNRLALKTPDSGPAYLYRLIPNPSGLSSAEPVEQVVLELSDDDLVDLSAAFAQDTKKGEA